MTNAPTPPSKEAVREWLMRRRASAQALPDIDRIRHELGWKTPQEAKDSPE